MKPEQDSAALEPNGNRLELKLDKARRDCSRNTEQDEVRSGRSLISAEASVSSNWSRMQLNWMNPEP